MTLEISGVIPVKQMITPHGVVLIPAKEKLMDDEQPDQLWTIAITEHPTQRTTRMEALADLTFGDSMRKIQEAFEDPKRNVTHCVIELQG